MEKQLTKLQAALQAAEDKLAMAQAKIKQADSVTKVKEKLAREYEQVVAVKSAEAQAREQQMQAQLDQLTDMLAAVQNRVGKEHAYATALRDQVTRQTAALQAALGGD